MNITVFCQIKRADIPQTVFPKRFPLDCEIRSVRWYVHELGSATIALRFHAILILFVMIHDFFRRDRSGFFWDDGFDLLKKIERAFKVSMTIPNFSDKD